MWDILKEAKERLVHDVAIHLISLFNLRFSLAGSLFSPQGTVILGPLVTTPFFRALDGQMRFPQSAPLDLTKFRGPFTCATDLLSNSPKAELYVIDGVSYSRSLKETKLSLNLGSASWRRLFN